MIELLSIGNGPKKTSVRVQFVFRATLHKSTTQKTTLIFRPEYVGWALRLLVATRTNFVDKAQNFRTNEKNASIQMLKNIHRGRQLTELRNTKLINKHKSSFDVFVLVDSALDF